MRSRPTITPVCCCRYALSCPGYGRKAAALDETCPVGTSLGDEEGTNEQSVGILIFQYGVMANTFNWNWKDRNGCMY